MKIPLICAAALAMSLPLSADSTVDVHAHAIPPCYRALLSAHDAEGEEGVPLPDWSAGTHAAMMDAAGISRSVLTLPAPLPWFGDPTETRAGIRAANEAAAELCRAYPERFAFCASLPLPTVADCLEEIAYAQDVLGAVGFRLPTNVRGVYLGDPRLDPILAALDARGAAVILHPHRPEPLNPTLVLPPALYEYHAETTRAVVNLFTHDVFARYPNIRWVVPHGGAFLPLALPRLKALQTFLPAPVDWDAALAKIWVDLAGVTDAAQLRALAEIIPPSRWLYGSDYPYQNAAAAPKNRERLVALIAGDFQWHPYLAGILGGNAGHLFFGDPAPEPDWAVKTPVANEPLARITRLEIDPAHLEAYREALRIGTSTSMRKEPGVLSLYAVEEKERPGHITILEIYAGPEAYREHIASPHFQEYKTGTLPWVKDLQLIDGNAFAPAMTTKPPKNQDAQPR